MTHKTTILLAEDEPALGQIVKESLESREFKVLLCSNGELALKTYKAEKPALLVLDVMMPLKDGFTLAKEIRSMNANVPIIFLTSRSQTQDVVEGFAIGGNDYLKKPFSIEELIARINNLLNTTHPEKTQNNITIGNFTFNLTKQTLQFKELKHITLTHREAQLLFHLYNNKNNTLERSIILDKLWDNNDFFSARSMDVYISKLRKKLSKDPNIKIINVRGVGYKLVC